MREIAEVLQLVLGDVVAGTTSKGEPSRMKYTLSAGAAEHAKRRIGDLLARYLLYPELDLEILEQLSDVGS